jgi:hypothetical protein
MGDSKKYDVHFRFGEGRGVALAIDDKSFYPHVKRWQYVAANRQRMTDASRESLAEEVLHKVFYGFARESGTDMRAVANRMAQAGVVEVAMPWQQEDLGWAARQFPWEMAVSLITRPYRKTSGRAFTVLRHLECANAQPARATTRKAVVVCSSPGEIGEHYRMDEECAMVKEILDRSDFSTTALSDPDRQQVFAAIEEHAAEVVHLAGLDPAGLSTIGITANVEGHALDGFVLKASGASPGKSGFDPVSPDEVGALVSQLHNKPLLMSFSSCYSARRMAATCVAHGVRHAIGFQDTVTDADAMLFFTSFYRSWAAHGDVLAAFREGRLQWMRQAAMPSAAVVLWSAESLLVKEAAATQLYRGALEAVGALKNVAVDLADSFVAARPAPAEMKIEPPPLDTPPPSVAPAKPAATPDDLHLVVELNPDRVIGGRTRVTTSLNYSLLHNDRTPFRTFLITKSAAGKLPPLQVEVSLEAGAEPCRCRFSEELPEEPGTVVLANRIRLPLVASLLRKCTESLRTNLYIRVSCGDRLLRETSEKITNLPADEWRDDGDDHRWLPCFVLPRDPAVLKLVDAGQRYLRTLLDDCSAGFDGYQRVAGANAAQVVDPQVQAIWAALQHDMPLSYINPPPSYTTFSQRLRTPSEIFRGQAGTCIDLALLFASCLEFVGIYPVIFLIRGHAFPGYWRSDEGWWKLSQFDQSAASASTPADPAAPITSALLTDVPGSTGQPERWLYSRNTLGELMRYVQNGSLVPFESTFVTRRLPYAQALETAVGNLHPQTFDAMLDVQTARCENVTPLPILEMA